MPLYTGKAVVVSLVNTGLMAVVSVSLTDEWSEFNAINGDLCARCRRRRTGSSRSGSRAFASAGKLPGPHQRIPSLFVRSIQVGRSGRHVQRAAARRRKTAFGKMFSMTSRNPLMRKGGEYLSWLEEEGRKIPPEESVAHRNFAQTALHPLLLRAPFVYRTFAKPLGYAGDYEMVNQILADPRQGSSTYFQIVNALFLRAAVAAGPSQPDRHPGRLPEQGRRACAAVNSANWRFSTWAAGRPSRSGDSSSRTPQAEPAVLHAVRLQRKSP